MGERYLDGDVRVGSRAQDRDAVATTTRAKIGPDRLVNAVAGYEKLGGPCTIVDFGTAVTYDVARSTASTSASPPVAIACISSPSSARRRARMPSTMPANP